MIFFLNVVKRKLRFSGISLYITIELKKVISLWKLSKYHKNRSKCSIRCDTQDFNKFLKNWNFFTNIHAIMQFLKFYRNFTVIHPDVGEL